MTNYDLHLGGPAPKSTSPFFAVFGSFRSQSWRLPYFSANLSVKDAADYLRLSSEIPGMDEKDWKVDELYQRDIDWKRVDNGLVPYLREDTAKFFNAITVVLIPKREGGAPFRANFDTETNWKAPAEGVMRLKNQVTVGPLRFGFFEQPLDERGVIDFNNPANDVGEVCWNLDEVQAVAIDGQHRLASLKELLRTNSNDAALMSTKVPVLFLLFHEKFGFESGAGEDSNRLLRRVFVDLNKNSVQPSRARVILLDDKTPQSFNVRSLMTSTLREDANSLSESPPRLPLALVDWHSEQAKFMDGPYLATVLGLDWLVSEFLDSKDIKSFLDYSLIIKQVKSLQTKLVIDLKEALARLQQLDDLGQTPFSFEDYEVERIERAFTSVFSAPIMVLLTEFSPYKELIKLRHSQGSLSVAWQHWYRLFEKEKRGDLRAASDRVQYENDLKNRAHPVNPSDFEEKLQVIENYKNDNLAFAVIFQKCYLMGFNEFMKVSVGYLDEPYELNPSNLQNAEYSIDENSISAWVSMEDEFTSDGDDPNVYEENSANVDSRQVEKGQDYQDKATRFVDALNVIVSKQPKFLSVNFTFDFEAKPRSFWQGSLLKPGGGIDFNQVAAKRAKDLLVGSIFVQLLKSTTDRPTAYSSFDDLWSEILENSPSSPKLVRLLGVRVKAMTNQEQPTGFAERILAQLEIEYDLDKARDEVRSRLLEVWNWL